MSQFAYRFGPVGQVQATFLKVLTGVILLFAAAQISIPLQPVPVTLQSVAVLLIGLLYTPRQAFQSVSTYLFLGAIGLPVFANFHAGAIWLVGKTGGYLIGFLIAAMAMSVLQSRWRTHTYFPTFLLCLLGQGIIYICGVSWLATFIGIEGAIVHGVLPFIFPGIVKSALLVGALRTIGYFQEKRYT